MEQEPTIYVVLTTDNTVGTVTMYREPYENESLVVYTQDENGNKLHLIKRFKAILDTEEC